MISQVRCAAAALLLTACGPSRQEVSWPAPDGAQIHGVLHLPRDARNEALRYPLVVFVNGSGRTPALEVAVVRAHADELTRRGFAVLTYDKRGTGATGGDFPASFEVMAQDLHTGVAWIQRSPYVDPNRTSIIALSQGWWVTALAVDQGMHARALVGIGAASVSPAVQQEHVLASEMRAGGASAEDVEQAMALLRQWADATRGALPRADYERALHRAQSFAWFTPIADQFALWPENDAYGAWYRGIMDFDPMPLLRRNQIPTTIFQGENDALVSPERNAADYVALRAAGAPIEFRLVHGVGHDLSHRTWIFPRQWDSSYWNALDGAIRATWRTPSPTASE